MEVTVTRSGQSVRNSFSFFQTEERVVQEQCYNQR